MQGLRLDVIVDRVVDGDTIRVFLPGVTDRSESLRILALDTEEVHPGEKPVTPLGHKASDFAKSLVQPGQTVTIEFPGPEPFEVANVRYRDNYGRLLVFVYLADGTDLQEALIGAGLSPYFTKYGYAEFEANHQRYVAAEMRAQSGRLGVWDQIANNGAEFRNYAALGTWWDLRARVIEAFRHSKRTRPDDPPYDTRLDFEQLRQLAIAGAQTTVFTELRSFRPAGRHVVFSTGSLAQPFTVFVPDANEGGNADLMRLLLTRYVSESETRPRRSYAYLTGPLKMYPDAQSGTPELVLSEMSQIADGPDWLAH